MRTLKATAVFLLAFLTVAPAPAQAWWGWLDDLSGPGRFRGPQFEFRLMCFGPESEAKRLLEDYKSAVGLTQKLLATAAITRDAIVPADIAAAQQAWRQVTADLTAARLTFPVVDKTAETSAVNTAATVDVRLGAVLQTAQRTQRQLGQIGGDQRSQTNLMEQPAADNATREIDDLSRAFSTAQLALQPVISQAVRGIAAVGSTGVFLSACSTDKKRRSSFEVGVNFWYADPSPSFANNEQIRLTTIMPLFSFRVFTDPRFDFVDAGVGAGVYWFSSKGFESFSGVVLQPGRFDFHAPTVWGAANDLRRVLASPTFRFSVIDFPSGFAPEAFGGVGAHHVRIPGELVKSWTLFFNIEPFIRQPPFKKKNGRTGS